MKNTHRLVLMVVATAILGFGCNKPAEPPPAPAAPTPPAAPSTPAPSASAPAPVQPPPVAAPTVPAPAVPSTPVPPAPPTNAPGAGQPGTAAAVGSGAMDFVRQLAVGAGKDAVLAGLGQDLGKVASTLAQSVSGDSGLKGTIESTVRSVAGGQELQALDTAHKLTEAKLSPEQLKLAKELKDTVAAYAVQRQLSGVEGVQGDVAAVVNGLRKGEVVTALPAVQRIAQNAKLSDAQKQFVSALSERYAPSLKQAADALQQGLKGLKVPGR